MLFFFSLVNYKNYENNLICRISFFNIYTERETGERFFKIIFESSQEKKKMIKRSRRRN